MYALLLYIYLMSSSSYIIQAYAAEDKEQPAVSLRHRSDVQHKLLVDEEKPDRIANDNTPQFTKVLEGDETDDNNNGDI